MLALIFSATTESLGQNVIFKNQTDQPLLKYLDTSVRVDGKRINIFIGPIDKFSHNTIFFNKPFVISNSTIDTIRIKGAFLQHITFTNCTFTLPIVIDTTNFDTLFISQSNIKHLLDLHNTRVRDFRLTQNNLPQTVSLSECSVDFFAADHSIFPENFSIINSTIKNLSFKKTSFMGILNLSKNSIINIVKFDSSIFDKNLNLSYLDTTVQPQFSFLNVILPDTLDLSYNYNLQYPIDLTKVNTFEKRKKCKILLYRTAIEKINLDYFYFRLIFPPGLSKDETIAQYENLLQNFKSRNYLESYKLLDIEYREYKTQQETPFWWVSKLWSNYGYAPARVFYWVGIFLILFSFMNSMFLNTLLNKVYRIEFVPTLNNKSYWPRFWASVIYTAAIFFTLPIKWEKINFKNILGTLYLFFQFSIGMVCLWYIGKFIL